MPQTLSERILAFLNPDAPTKPAPDKAKDTEQVKNPDIVAPMQQKIDAMIAKAAQKHGLGRDLQVFSPYFKGSVCTVGFITPQVDVRSYAKRRSPPQREVACVFARVPKAGKGEVGTFLVTSDGDIYPASKGEFSGEPSDNHISHRVSTIPLDETTSSGVLAKCGKEVYVDVRYSVGNPFTSRTDEQRLGEARNGDLLAVQFLSFPKNNNRSELADASNRLDRAFR